MKKTDLLEAFGCVNEKYLNEAEERADNNVKNSISQNGDCKSEKVGIMDEKKYIKKKLEPIIAIAASFVLVVGTVIFVGARNWKSSVNENTSPGSNGNKVQLVNYMTEKELNCVSSSGLTLIEEETDEHTVQLELWNSSDYIEWLEENKSHFSEDAYNQCYEFYANNECTYINGVLIDGRYYTGFMPTYQYKGGELYYSYTQTVTTDDAAGEPVSNEVSFDTFEEFKAWYIEYLDDRVYNGEISQYEADREYEDMLIIFDSVMNGTYTVLDNPIEEYLTEKSYKGKWEFNADEVSEISSCITEYSVYDEELDDEFIVHVTLPPDYDESENYPALVLTDGIWRFGNHPALRKMMVNNEADDVILISIGCDFSVDGTDNAVRAKYFCEESELFLDFITDNLMPYLGSCYNIDFSSSALYGHSLGGVFTHYAAFNSDLYENQPFGNYIIGSPAFWSPYFQPTENSSQYKTEYGYFERNDSFDKNLYICGGENEDPDYEEYYGENESTLEGIDSLMLRLEEYGVSSAESKIYENSNHYEYIPDMLCEFLTKYYLV